MSACVCVLPLVPLTGQPTNHHILFLTVSLLSPVRPLLAFRAGKRMLLRFSTADERERWNLTLSSMLSSSRGSEWTPPVLPPASTKATAAKPAYDSYYDDAYDPSGGTAMAAAV